MVGIDTAARALTTGLVVLVGCLFGAYLVRDYRIDALRQELFRIRDELFDYAATGAVSFSHPAYSNLRSRLNLTIRFGHRLTFTRLLLVALSYRLTKRTPVTQANWLRDVESLRDKEVEARLRSFQEQFALVLARHIVTGNPIPMAIVVVWAVVEAVAHGFTVALRAAYDPIIIRIPKLEEQIVDDDFGRMAMKIA
jgi:hypothetical protein